MVGMTRPVTPPASTSTPLRARIYARASLDKSGKRASVERQIEQRRTLIAARGFVESGPPYIADVQESIPESVSVPDQSTSTG